MNLESLGGANNSFEAKQPSDKKLERTESQQSFEALLLMSAKKAVRIFKEEAEFMTMLRSELGFQTLKNNRDFDNEQSFSAFAQDMSSALSDRFDVEDTREQAALLAVLAKLDAMQDDDLRKQEALERAKE